MNGDTLVGLDWEGLLQLKSNAIALMLSDDHERYGSVEVDPETGQAEEFSEKDPAKNSQGWVNAGVYLFSRSDLLSIRKKIDFKDRKLSLEDDLMPLLLEKGLSGFTRVSGFIDIGTPESLREVRQKMGE
jgi:NDP-sugar pyrophosphorylase family protein